MLAKGGCERRREDERKARHTTHVSSFIKVEALRKRDLSHALYETDRPVVPVSAASISRGFVYCGRLEDASASELHSS